MSDKPQYFANLPTDEIGPAINQRMGSYYMYGSPASQVAWRQMWAWMFAYGYGRDWFHGTSQVVRGGDQGEMAYVRMNQARSILNAAVAQIVTPQIQWHPQAERYSSASVRATLKAKDVLNHIWHNGGAKRTFTQAAEVAAMLGEAFVMQDWNPFAGRDAFTNPMTGRVERAGEYEFQLIYPWDVIRNAGRPTYDDVECLFIRLRPNRWNLAARFPDKEEDIVRGPSAYPSDGTFGFGIIQSLGLWDRDAVGCVRFIHKPTAAVPEGRDILMLRNGVVLSDKPLGAKGMMPLRRIQKAALHGTPYGYTEFFDCLGAQEVYDNLHSAFTTNLMGFATQFIAYERGTNPDIMTLGGGMALLPYDPQGKPPQGINLTALPQGGFQYLATLKTEMEQFMGQNPVTRGQSPGDRAPASLAALLDATSARMANSFMQSYLEALREAGTYSLRLFAENVVDHVPYRIGLEQGAPMTANRWKDVRPEDIDGIDQVYVDIGNSDTAPARMQFAELISQIKDPDARKQVIQVWETGRIEPMVEASEEQYDLVLAENESICRGETPTALPADDDFFHAKQHGLAVLTPAARTNPQILQAYMDHIKQHYSQAFGVPLDDVGKIDGPMIGPDGMPVVGPDGQPLTAPGMPGPDPNYRQNMQILLGKPVTPPNAATPPMGPMGPSGMPPPPGAGGPPPPPGAGGPPLPGGTNPASAGAKPVELPKIASTGQKWSPGGGGTQLPTG